MRIVDIKGGFGNQLFQYAFALNLQRQGHRVYAYFSKGYKNNEKTNSYSEKREIIIKSKDFGIKKMNITFYYLLELFKKIPLINNKFYEIIFEEEYNVNYKFKAVTSLNGFWQDLTIVENILDELKQVFLTKKILSKDKKNRTLVQVRRGDFLLMNKDLKISFYKESLLIIDSDISKIDFDVVTDDVEWVKSQKLFSYAKNIYPPSDNKKDVLELFKHMLKYKNYIVGNSTFCLWAALISSSTDSKVIIEKKFSEDIRLNETVNFSKWLVIKNS